jgi:hypothetical protein
VIYFDNKNQISQIKQLNAEKHSLSDSIVLFLLPNFVNPRHVKKKKNWRKNMVLNNEGGYH